MEDKTIASFGTPTAVPPPTPAKVEGRRKIAAKHLTMYELLMRGIECSLASRDTPYDVIVDHNTVMTRVSVVADLLEHLGFGGNYWFSLGIG